MLMISHEIWLGSGWESGMGVPAGWRFNDGWENLGWSVTRYPWLLSMRQEGWKWGRSGASECVHCSVQHSSGSATNYAGSRKQASKDSFFPFFVFQFFDSWILYLTTHTPHTPLRRKIILAMRLIEWNILFSTSGFLALYMVVWAGLGPRNGVLGSLNFLMGGG